MMKTLTVIAAFAALSGTPALAADMAVKAPPSAPAPVPTWTGFYGGIEFGGGWGDTAVNFSPNDPLAASLPNGTVPTAFGGTQPVASGYRVSQSGPVGGFEVGYNWQASSWLLGLETDFSLAGMSGRATSPSSILTTPPGPTPVTQFTTAEQSTDWYGTVRGRVGWLATPNLLVFGTGGFAYGRTSASVTYTEVNGSLSISGAFSFNCSPNVPCFVGSASAIRTGWTAGGGVEWLLDQHWSAKIEYQFVDLGTETVRVSAVAVGAPGETPASFNAALNERFNVVRLGLNYRY